MKGLIQQLAEANAKIVALDADIAQVKQSEADALAKASVLDGKLATSEAKVATLIADLDFAKNAYGADAVIIKDQLALIVGTPEGAVLEPA
jgi:hypothetical protein